MIRFDNSYLRDLPGAFLRLAPAVPPAPRLLVGNQVLAAELGIDLAGAEGWLSGATLPEGAEPAALAYAGHQFGGFSPQLGDGRAHLLGEFLGPDGRRWDLQLKGSGRTPFSRGGDGKAVVGPMLREFLISEAMAALGVPTTRSLTVVATGETVLRQEGPLPGAVLSRVAASHIRVGTFQFFAARGQVDMLQSLTEYTLARHYPGVEGALGLFDAVVARQVRLLAQWMGLGFVHGVMNTDNMALSGETIDYGPCAFMDAYAEDRVFSSIDRRGRYAYGNQPGAMAWNLARLAEALLPLFDADENRAVELANDRLQAILPAYEAAFLDEMRRKMGLLGQDAGDKPLLDDLLSLMPGRDWTGSFRSGFAGFGAWRERWLSRAGDGAEARVVAANPAVIPRNHLVEAALQSANTGDMAPFHRLLEAVRDPFALHGDPGEFALPGPENAAPYVTFCGT